MTTTTTATSLPDYYDGYDGFEYDEEAEACAQDDLVAFGSVFLPALYSVVFAAGLVGNALVLLALGSGGGDRGRGPAAPRSATDVYLLNLAAADLLLAATLPLWARYAASARGLPHAACRLATALFFVGLFGSVFFLTLLSVERYLAVVRPAAARLTPLRSVPRGVTLSLGVWAAAMLAAAPQFMFTGSKARECLGDYPDDLRSVWPVLRHLEANVLGFALPVLVMGFCYGRVLRALCACADPRRARAARLVLLVALVFLLFWTPYHVLLFLETLRGAFGLFPSCPLQRDLRLGLMVSETLAFTHCCLNPFIYAFAGRRFRGYLGHLARKWLGGVCACARCCRARPGGGGGHAGHAGHAGPPRAASSALWPDSTLGTVGCTQITSEGQESVLL
ncbi:LOW QUALITY PROTEIN: CX3C chemokine receptor 1 [Perognathus longimembris pacificus]|uniref:LOW QUALITY PROTEIN: CX3C chemokine receptor 1 n=1 Tax=Perognathus longimembris pacificus TaxID=214514 RepID=UPI002019EF8F|nr:LOW QUALITY PROTEIN: CX3C chemokine receptor 1 [Perognathus longimembris pacificus]